MSEQLQATGVADIWMKEDVFQIAWLPSGTLSSHPPSPRFQDLQTILMLGALHGGGRGAADKLQHLSAPKQQTTAAVIDGSPSVASIEKLCASQQLQSSHCVIWQLEELTGLQLIVCSLSFFNQSRKQEEPSY